VFVYVIWGIIILAIALSFKRLVSGLVVLGVFLAALFFVTFVLDSGSDFPLRKYVPLNWFDETVEDPEGKMRELGEDFKDAGKDVAEKIDETGKKLDIKYGTGDSKEWVSVEGGEEGTGESKDQEVEKEQGENKKKESKEGTKKEGNKNKKDKNKGKEDKKDKGVKKDKEQVDLDKKGSKYKKDGKELVSDEMFIRYEEVKDVLKEELNFLGERDKELIRTMTNIYKTKFEGEDIIVWNTGGEGKEGIYVKYK